MKTKILSLLISFYILTYFSPVLAKEPIKPAFENRQVQALIDKAWAALDYDFSILNMDEAIKYGEEALALDPGNYVLLYIVADFYAQKVARMPTGTNSEREAILVMARKGLDYARKSLAIKETAAGYTWAISCYSMLYRDRNFAAQLTASPEIIRLVNKIEECDPDYFYGVSARLRSRLALATPKPNQVARGQLPLVAEVSGLPPGGYISFAVDGRLKSLTNAAPHEYLLDTLTCPDGRHEVTVEVCDAAGRTLGFWPFSSLEKALADSFQRHGAQAGLAVLPYAPDTLPIVDW